MYPGAPELCDYIDNNCNGQVDENARASCGVGWCRRLGESCSSSSCTPGQPRAEICNDFDDDCDGVADNGTDLELCGATGLTCVAGACVKPGTVPVPVSGPDAGVAASGGTSLINLTGAAGEGVPPSREQGGCALAGAGPVAPAPFAVCSPSRHWPSSCCARAADAADAAWGYWSGYTFLNGAPARSVTISI